MKRSRHGIFVFPPKKTLIWRRHCSIGQSCCSMTSKRSIGWFLESSRAWIFFSSERSLNQPKATRVCIRSINQSNRSIYIRLLFLFCLRVFISRSYENHSIVLWRGFCSVSFQYFVLRHLVIASSTTPRNPVFLKNNDVVQVAFERLQTDFNEITISVARDIPLLYSTGRVLWCGQ